MPNLTYSFALAFALAHARDPAELNETLSAPLTLELDSKLDETKKMVREEEKMRAGRGGWRGGLDTFTSSEETKKQGNKGLPSLTYLHLRSLSRSVAPSINPSVAPSIRGPATPLPRSTLATSRQLSETEARLGALRSGSVQLLTKAELDGMQISLKYWRKVRTYVRTSSCLRFVHSLRGAPAARGTRTAGSAARNRNQNQPKKREKKPPPTAGGPSQHKAERTYFLDREPKSF